MSRTILVNSGQDPQDVTQPVADNPLAGLSLFAATLVRKLTPVVRDDVHGGFLCAGRRTVDTAVVTEVAFDLSRIHVWLLGRQAFIEVLVVPMPQQFGGLLRRGVSLVQRVVHTAVV